MGHYDEQYAESDRKHREKMQKDGYIEVPTELLPLFNNRHWVHRNDVLATKAALKRFLES